jgi:hypothetical protein
MEPQILALVIDATTQQVVIVHAAPQAQSAIPTASVNKQTTAYRII